MQYLCYEYFINMIELVNEADLHEVHHLVKMEDFVIDLFRKRSPKYEN